MTRLLVKLSPLASRMRCLSGVRASTARLIIDTSSTGTHLRLEREARKVEVEDAAERRARADRLPNGGHAKTVSGVGYGGEGRGGGGGGGTGGGTVGWVLQWAVVVRQRFQVAESAAYGLAEAVPRTVTAVPPSATPMEGSISETCGVAHRRRGGAVVYR